jgi:hypothetical protein
MDSNHKNILLAIIIAFSVFLTLYLIFHKHFESFSNGNFYTIKRFSNNENAKFLLLEIDKNLIKLIQAFNTKYVDIPSLNMCDEQKNLLSNIKKKLNKTYKSNSLQENYPTVIGKEVSYNVDKGDIISICLRNFYNPDEFHEMNDLMFVSIHELSHSCNKSYGHDKKFWKIFRILLEVAIEDNIYNNINYQIQPKNYCSMNITYNPIFDRSLDDKEYFKN